MYKLLVVFLGALILSGCQNNIDYSVTAISDQKSDLKSYYLYPTSKDKDINSLEFRNVSKYVETALNRKGYTRSEDPSYADFMLGLNYVINNVNISYSQVDVPLYGNVGYSSIQTNGYGNSFTLGNNIHSNYSSTTTLTPAEGIIGYSTKTVSNRNYLSFLSLDAATLNNNTLYPIWKVSVATQTGKLSDVEILKTLSGISSQYANKNTGEPVLLSIPIEQIRN